MQQLHEGTDLAATFLFQGLPPDLGEFIDFYLDVIQAGAPDHGRDLPLANLQMDDRTIAGIGAPTGQAIGEIAVALQIFAPCDAPESGGNVSPLDHHRRNLFSCPSQFGHRHGGLRLPLGYRDIRLVTVVKTHGYILSCLLV